MVYTADVNSHMVCEAWSDCQLCLSPSMVSRRVLCTRSKRINRSCAAQRGSKRQNACVYMCDISFEPQSKPRSPGVIAGLALMPSRWQHIAELCKACACTTMQRYKLHTCLTAAVAAGAGKRRTYLLNNKTGLDISTTLRQ